MARSPAYQLSALCFLPKGLLGADGRFDSASRPGQSGLLASTDPASPAVDTGFSRPARPKRYSVYNTVTWRGSWEVPVSDELEDPWHSIFDDFKEWMSGSRAEHCLAIAGVAAISIGTYAATNQVMSHFEKRHPLNDLIYDARAVHDRWLLQAATSRSIVTAVTTYEERHGGRVPPPNFGEWYQFASGSAVIDDFHQIDKDLEIFWTMTPATLRKRVKLVTSYIGVGSITVKDGRIVASDLAGDGKSPDLNELIDMINKFSRHLPDMVIPVNLNHAPRVIPSWADKRLHNQEYLHAMAKIISMRSENEPAPFADILGPSGSSTTGHDQSWHQTGANELRQMFLEASDRVTMILPLDKSEESFTSESVMVREANHDLSFNIGVGEYHDSCLGKTCDLIKQMYGQHTDGEDPLNYRYVLLTDEDDGPPKSLLEILRSQSVPFISTIFQTWYSTRLTPWLHFVPVDTRYHALHATVLYFTGTANRAKMNGIDKYLKGRPGDAEWIAQQGQRWAARALRKEDREIYLFRLLLEWGRLIDDRRDSIGYRKDVEGEYKSDEWSRSS
ncbi:hypothetical protein E4U41_001554 [Claviceps citrina]|nr:hypothetical protein E4U41_001554 [Claviceps citrina]